METERRILIYFDELVTLLARTYKMTFDKRIYSPNDILSSMQGITPVDAMVIPCKVGDLVWGIRKYNRGRKVKQGIVQQMFFGEDMRLCICVTGACRGEWGKTIFATKEEADAMLAKIEEGESCGN